MAASSQKTDFLTPIGRLVQGSVWVLNDKDRNGNPLRTLDMKPKLNCFFALAIDKKNPEFGPFYQQMVQVARTGFPQYFDAQGNCTHPTFAWKLMDGDGRDNDGRSNAEKQGFAGHWVLKFSGSFLPRCFAKGRYDESQRLTDTNTIKTGYFVRVGGNMSVNVGSPKPGIYLNADLIELNFNGDEIVSGRDANETFGNAAQAGYVPQGAIPLGQSVAIGQPQMQQPQMQPQGQQVYQPNPMPPQGGYSAQQPNMGMPQPQMQPGGMAVPGSNVQPNPGFTQGAMMQAGVQPNMGMQQPQMQRTLVLTTAAGNYTLEQFRANGFNDQQMIDQGFAVWQ